MKQSTSQQGGEENLPNTRPYQSPFLRFYGDLRDLTTSGTGKMVEGVMQEKDKQKP